MPFPFSHTMGEVSPLYLSRIYHLNVSKILMELDPLSSNSTFIKRESQWLNFGKILNPNLIIKPECRHYFFLREKKKWLCVYIHTERCLLWKSFDIKGLVKVLLILLSSKPSAAPDKINVCWMESKRMGMILIEQANVQPEVDFIILGTVIKSPCL